MDSKTQDLKNLSLVYQLKVKQVSEKQDPTVRQRSKETVIKVSGIQFWYC